MITVAQNSATAARVGREGEALGTSTGQKGLPSREADGVEGRGERRERSEPEPEGAFRSVLPGAGGAKPARFRRPGA